jgi:signal transduction histidine kinase
VTLSIAQRLTITTALLGALVLAPAGIIFYTSQAHRIEAKAMTQAKLNTMTIYSAVHEQLDKSQLVSFADEGGLFDGLRVSFDHWAIVRKNGRVEKAQGLMRDTRLISIAEGPLLVRLSKDRCFTVASAQLMFETSLPWRSLPNVVKKQIEAQGEPGTFLSADSEISRGLNVFSVRILYGDHIREVEVTADGEQLEDHVVELSTKLPQELCVRTPSGKTLSEPRIEGWRVFNGELVAIFKGTLPGAEPSRVAINEFGEQFHLNLNGEIDEKLDGSRLWIVAAHDMDAGFAQIRLVAQATATGVVVLWIFITLTAYFVTKHALKPVREIVTQAERINPTQLDVRLPIGPVDDELSSISRTVNKMLDRIQTGFQREQQFTGDASHEMRNPLAKMIAEVDLALSRPREAQEYREILDRLKIYSQGMQRLTESLLMLARLDGRLEDLEIGPFDGAELAMEILKPLAEDATQRIHLELGRSTDPLQVIGNRHLIGVLLRNLIDNALRYSPAQSPVYVRINKNTQNIHFEVEDEGPGIPEDKISLAFNRFHRLDQSRSQKTGGLGLGLAIVKAIADVHSIDLVLKRGREDGTLVAFSLAALNETSKEVSHDRIRSKKT